MGDPKRTSDLPSNPLGGVAKSSGKPTPVSPVLPQLSLAGLIESKSLADVQSYYLQNPSVLVDTQLPSPVSLPPLFYAAKLGKKEIFNYLFDEKKASLFFNGSTLFDGDHCHQELKQHVANEVMQHLMAKDLSTLSAQEKRAISQALSNGAALKHKKTGENYIEKILSSPDFTENEKAVARTYQLMEHLDKHQLDKVVSMLDSGDKLDFSIQDSRGNTPLHYAFHYARKNLQQGKLTTESISFINKFLAQIESQANRQDILGKVDMHGKTALQQAVALGDISLVGRLLAAGANLLQETDELLDNTQTSSGSTRIRNVLAEEMIFQALLSGYQDKGVDRLEKLKLALSHVNEIEIHEICIALEFGNLAALEILLQSGKLALTQQERNALPQILEKVKSEWNANDYEQVKQLLTEHGGINSQASNGNKPVINETSLIVAVKRRDYRTVRELLEQLPPEQLASTLQSYKDKEGMNALHWACIIGDQKIATLLIEASVEQKNDGSGSSPLLMSKDKHGRTPIDLAFYQQNESSHTGLVAHLKADHRDECKAVQASPADIGALPNVRVIRVKASGPYNGLLSNLGRRVEDVPATVSVIEENEVELGSVPLDLMAIMPTNRKGARIFSNELEIAAKQQYNLTVKLTSNHNGSLLNRRSIDIVDTASTQKIASIHQKKVVVTGNSITDQDGIPKIVYATVLSMQKAILTKQVINDLPMPTSLNNHLFSIRRHQRSGKLVVIPKINMRPKGGNAKNLKNMGLETLKQWIIAAYNQGAILNADASVIEAVINNEKKMGNSTLNQAGLEKKIQEDQRVIAAKEKFESEYKKVTDVTLNNVIKQDAIEKVRADSYYKLLQQGSIGSVTKPAGRSVVEPPVNVEELGASESDASEQNSDDDAATDSGRASDKSAGKDTPSENVTILPDGTAVQLLDSGEEPEERSESSEQDGRNTPLPAPRSSLS